MWKQEDRNNSGFQTKSQPRRVGTDQSRIGFSDLKGPNITPGPQWRSKPLKLDADAIFERAKVHKRYQSGKPVRLMTHNLPEFEALYQGDEEEADTQLKFEVNRLIDAVGDDSVEIFGGGISQGTSTTIPTDGDSSPASASSAHSSPSHSSTSLLPEKPMDPPDVSTVLNCIDHLLSNLAVCKYKNCLLVIDNLRWCYTADGIVGIFQSALEDLQDARKWLLSRLVHHCEFIETDALAPLLQGTSSSALYDQLLDYITAYVAKILVQSAAGPAWYQNTLALLARLSRKLRELKSSAQQHAEQCIASTDYLHEDLKDENSDAGKHFKFRFDGSSSFDIIDDSIYLKDYFREQSTLRRPLYDTLSEILLVLRLSLTDQSPRFYKEDFDYSILVQNAGHDSTLVLSSDDQKNISISTDEVAGAFSLTACRILTELARKMDARSRKPLKGAAGSLQWWSNDGRKMREGSAFVENINDGISTLIALALTSTAVSQNLSYLLEFVSIHADDHEEIKYSQSPLRQKLAVTFSQSPIAPSISDPTRDVVTLTLYTQQQKDIQSCSSHAYHLGNHLDEQYEKYCPAINSWTIDGETISVKCPWVVAGIIIPTGIIALAGVALLLSPYKKPKNVDPSNFMIFLWSIALSFLLVGKAFYVPDWPWHDFLRASVSCRSVKEVSRISGVKEQVVVMHLLSYARSLTLRGPYCLTLFPGANNDDDSSSTKGFSIDVPIDLPTLYASGFLVLKVNTFSGPRVVCVRGGPRVDAAFDTRSDSSSHIVGELPRHSHSKTSSGDHETKIRLETKNARWHHVYGLYVNKSVKFV